MKNSKTSQNDLKSLPSEIIIEILSRLPIPTIIMCKLVCKPWLNLLTTPEFVKPHLSNSVPCLAVSQQPHNEKQQVFEFADELSPKNPTSCYTKTLKFEFPHPASIHSSVNGLLFLNKSNLGPLYICNPNTREYIELPPPPQGPLRWAERFRFGVSKTTGQYKLLRVADANPTKFEVYTLGTGHWRSIDADDDGIYIPHKTGVFVSGNLHWLGVDNREQRISCFDLETELFSTFSRPSPQPLLYRHSLTVLGIVYAYAMISMKVIRFLGSLIWTMRVYRDEKSWTRNFKIKKQFRVNMRYIKVVKDFNDGGILIVKEHLPEPLCFSTETNNTIGIIGIPGSIGTGVYTPSFFPVRKSLVMENVISF